MCLSYQNILHTMNSKKIISVTVHVIAKIASTVMMLGGALAIDMAACSHTVQTVQACMIIIQRKITHLNGQNTVCKL